MHPLISVIIPVFNVEEYLDKCVESIISQTYENLEIILVDDGSPDNCPSICDNWAKKDDRIRVIHKINGGLSDARNVGIDKASGEYLFFVDSDDYIAQDMIEKLYVALYENEADMSICNFKYVSEDNLKKFDNDNLPIKDEVLSGEYVLLNKIFEDKNWYWVVAWNKLYKKDLFDNIRYPFGKIHEDEFIIHQILFKCKKIACVSEMLYFYVQRNDSIMGNANSVSNKLDLVESLFHRSVFFANNVNLNSRALEVLLQGISCLNNSQVINYLSKNKTRRSELQKLYRYAYKSIRKVTINFSAKHMDIKKFYFISLYWTNKMLTPYLQIKGRVLFLRTLVKYFFVIAKTDCLLTDTPQHGNLGDHAIVLAQEQLLKNQNIRYCELSANQIEGLEHWFARITPKNKTVLVPGGGFLGNLWIKEELRFRRILQAFSNHKIIVFPQTVTFDLSSEEGRKFFEESNRIYSSHPDLTLFVREKKSYDFMQKYMPDVKTILVPDIVTILRIPNSEYDRHGILMCMRSDLEKNITQEQYDYICSCILKHYPNEGMINTDTVVDHNIAIENRQVELDEKLNEFSKSKLVITDRLHGMVFAAITGTPCIALGNCNGKVKGVYEWIKSNSYINYVDDVKEIDGILEKIDLDKHYNYDYNNVEKNFVQLLELFKEE